VPTFGGAGRLLMATILLVDDEKIARAVYGDYLAEAGHEVTCVGTVAEARAALALHPVDVVVTDLILGSGDGMDVLQHTRERYPDVEVVVITALDKVDPAVRAIKNGAAEYLVKPVTPETLHHAVSRALMTRKLLAENAALKRHLSLVETGQRLLTVFDRSRLSHAAASAFVQLCQVEGTLLWGRGPDGVRLEAAEGLPPEVVRRLIVRFEAELPSLPARPFEADGGDGFDRIIGFPVGDAQRHRGWALLFAAGPFPEAARKAAEYLARHLAMGWDHLERFSRVEDLAYLDDLTRLYNARYLDEALDRELQAPDGAPFSVLFLDLDHFKSVNDNHGHLVGSKLLVEAARVIKSCTRDQDVVARWGGDEYVVLLRESDSGGALKVAERIRRAIESHAFLSREGYGLRVTVCIGVASRPEHATDRRTLLDLADRAMYRGKRTSRNVVYVTAHSAEETSARQRSGAA
jgi:two-component system cell cycle response regulator